jgi:hypothetical protein
MDNKAFKPTEEEVRLRTEIAEHEKLHGKNHPGVRPLLEKLGEQVLSENRFTEAHQLTRRAQDIREAGLQANGIFNFAVREGNHPSEETSDAWITGMLRMTARFGSLNEGAKSDLRQMVRHYALNLMDTGQSEDAVFKKAQALLEPYGISL